LLLEDPGGVRNKRLCLALSKDQKTKRRKDEKTKRPKEERDLDERKLF